MIEITALASTSWSGATRQRTDRQEICGFMLKDSSPNRSCAFGKHFTPQPNTLILFKKRSHSGIIYLKGSIA
ncbi:hypothetical protein L596_009501 [Steinernema carpocapsae]|uniref:Uncharacterized protein n=1 Tax=Steinernema carpocapsae TaxID=34508 RepID=A0A4V6A6N4_STECR|nr:hypothetical protein L596_009501 [Steinernema carpocapsae]